MSSPIPTGCFALRTPLLPLAALTSLGAGLTAPHAADAELDAALAADRARGQARLRALVADPVVREALLVASPSLDAALAGWLADPDHPRSRGVEASLVRYLARMAARATPFGLCAGCSTGVLGGATRLELAPRPAYRRHTRLDMHYLAALCEALARDPELRAALPVRPSTGLYEAAGQLRYAEARVDPTTGALAHHLVSLERSEPLAATLARAADGARPADLARALVEADPDIAREDADAYVDSLIDAQVLVSELAPPVTGDDPVRGVLATLAASPAGATAARRLAAADAALRALDRDGLGLAASRYRAVAEELAPLPVEPELARLFHVDLYKPVVRAELGGAVVRELRRAALLLAAIAPPRGDTAMDRFRAAFAERYGGAWVPLPVALDDEAGVGFAADGAGATEPTPLLDGLRFPADPTPPQRSFGPREAHLLRRIAEAERARAREWTLDALDRERLATAPPTPLPGAFDVLATLVAPSAEALARGDFRVVVHGLGGPSGARLFGRFCHGDPALRDAALAHLAAEEAARPDVVFAEVVHLPEGRMGNVVCRPVLRGWEIAHLGRSGAPADRQLRATELLVGIDRGRVVLWSPRLGREVVPRLTTAHDWSGAALGIYRFLGALQHERARFVPRWSWGALAGAPFLPRVAAGRVVLAPARWNLARDQLAPLADGNDADRWRAARRLRDALGLPRWVGLADGDNVLPVDLDDVLHLDAFARAIRGRDGVSLVELLELEDGATPAVSGPEGGFVHELVVPFTAAEEPLPAPRVDLPRAVRGVAPGSEWLYLKLYSGTATADHVLTDLVAPLVRAARAGGIAERWFFLRYADPHPHLRVRLRGDPRRLHGDTLAAVHAAAAPLLRDGRLWKLQLDTYDRELERYGGDACIELAEAIFEADSDAALAIVELLDPETGADARWRLALLGADRLLVDLGLDLERRTALIRRARARFGAEYHVDVADPSSPAHADAAGLRRALARRFRGERAALEELLAAPSGAGHPLDPGIALLESRSARLATLVAELHDRLRAGQSTAPLDDLAASFVHMHVNRLLRSAHRAQELVIYDLLLRLYESAPARARRR